MYGPLIIAYLFLGGASAGGFFAMATWSLAFPCTRAVRSTNPASTIAVRTRQAFASLQARTYTLCSLLLVLSITFLLWDLGSPEKALLILTRPHATVLTFGMVCLALEAAIGALLALGSVLPIRFLRRHRTRRVLQVLCCIVSLATTAYTGLFLMGNIGISLWTTWTIVPLFVFSSLSCGITLMLLVDYFTKDQTILLRAARPLQKLHLVCLAAEALFLGLFVSAAFANPMAASAVDVLLSPDVLPTAAIGVLGFGIAAPAVCEIYALSQQECRTIPASDVLCLVGGLILRYCVIVCGVH